MPKQWNVMQLLIMLTLYFYFLFNQTLCWKIFGNVKSARYFLCLSALLPNPIMTVQYNLLPGRLRCLWSRVGAGVRIEEHWQPAARAGECGGALLHCSDTGAISAGHQSVTKMYDSKQLPTMMFSLILSIADNPRRSGRAWGGLGQVLITFQLFPRIQYESNSCCRRFKFSDPMQGINWTATLKYFEIKQ